MTYINSIKALSNDSRREIIEALRHGPLSVGELAEQMPITQPAVSQHLKVLAEAELVTRHHKGTSRLYAIKPDGLADLRRYIESYWDTVLESFAQSALPGDDPQASKPRSRDE